MSHTPWAIAIAGLVLFSSAPIVRAAAAESAAYDSKIAAARSLAAEGSHAEARAAYAEAVALTNDGQQKRWTQLWALAEELAADRGHENAPHIRTELAVLLADYEKAEAPLARDRFWAAAKAVEATTHWASSPEALRLRFVIASFWAEQPVTAENEVSFVSAAATLGETLSGGNFDRLTTPLADSLALLRRATATPPLSPARARLALALARALEQQRRPAKIIPPLITAAYEAAVTATRGSPEQAEALLRRAQWMIRLVPLGRSRSPDPELTQGLGAAGGKIPEAEFTRLLDLINEAVAAAATQAPLDRSLRGLVEGLIRLRDELTTPSLQIDTSSAYLPESRLAFGVRAQHLREIAFALHRVDLATLHTVGFGKDKAPLPPSLLGATPLLSWSSSTGLDSAMGLVRLQLSRTEALAPGAYVLIARGIGGREIPPTVRWFLVTKAQAVAQIGEGRAVDVYAFEQETGKLLPNVRGHLWEGQRSAAIAPVEAGHGRGRTSESETRYSSLTLIGEADGQPFVIPSLYSQRREPHDEWLVHLLADRPLYQPGETAQWKLTLRHRVAGQLQVPSGLRLQVEAKTDADSSLGKWDVTLNALGSASGKLSIPALTAPGRVEFEVSVHDDDDDVKETIPAFAIEHFRPPETTLAIAPVDPAQIRLAQPGGDVELKIAARYFSGEPLAHANVAVTVRFTRHFTPFDAARDDEDDGGSIPSRLELSAVTDARGEALVRVALPVDLPRRVWIDLDAHLSSAGTTSQASYGFDLLPGGYTAEIASASQAAPTPAFSSYSYYPGNHEPRAVYAVPQQATELAIFTRDGRDEPVAVKGQLTISKKTWEEIWRMPDGQLLTGAALRERQRAATTWPPRELTTLGSWEQLRAEYRTETVAVIDVPPDASGRVTLKAPPLAAGYYELTYDPETSTRDGQPLTRTSLFVADATTPLPDYHASVPRIIPCANEQEPGKPIRALIILPVERRHAVIGLQGANTGDTRVEFFDGNARLLEFPWKAGYDAGVRLDVSVLATAFEESASETLKISRVPHQTAVTVVPEKELAQPGEKVRLRLHTSDAAGRPLSSEIAVSVADAAVASLTSSRQRSLADTFLQPVEIPPPSIARMRRAVFYGRANPPGGGQVSHQPGSGGTDDEIGEELLVLSPFQVATDSDRGYAASATLAGSRIAMADAGGAADVRVRSAFSYTAFWIPDVKTDRRGDATVEFIYPDNLTAWKINAEAIAEGNRFGAAQAGTRTSLPLQARLRTPRSLVVGDSAALLGVVLNQTSTPIEVRTELTTDPTPSVVVTAPSAQSATVPATGEKPLAWTAQAKAPGSSTLRFVALSGKTNDAMEAKLPVQEDGFFQSTGVTGRATDQTLQLAVMLPASLDPTRTKVELQISPGITPTLVQALPYLIDYPYGCVEQTVSRFLPAAVVAKLLRDLGFDAVEVEKAILPAEMPAPPGRKPAAGLGRLNAVIEQSLVRLQEASRGEGEFGWFPQGHTDPYMTAYVLRGLNVAATAGLALPGSLHRDTHAATLRFLAQDDPERPPQELAWMLDAVLGFPEKPDPKQIQLLEKVFAQLYGERAALGSSGLALLARAAHALRRPTEMAVLRRNLNDGVVRATSTEFGQTAQWGKTADYFSGLDGAVESTALCLQALLVLDPKDELADAAATWLLLNRQSGRWNNTRDTALAVLALHDYARARGETNAQGGYRLRLNGQVLAEKRFDRSSLLAPTTFVVEPGRLLPGRNQIQLERTSGDGPCYLVATTRSWAQAESTLPSGSFLKVSREFVRLEEKNTVIGLPTTEEKRLPATGAFVFNQERVECRLTLEVQQDLDYVILESPKPGGCEPLNPLSGWDAHFRRIESSAADLKKSERGYGSIYREEHDDRSVFFLPHLSAGRWEIRYTMRALFAGDFRVLPANAGAIYVPVLAANTDASRLAIKEAILP